MSQTHATTELDAVRAELYLSKVAALLLVPAAGTWVYFPRLGGLTIVALLFLLVKLVDAARERVEWLLTVDKRYSRVNGTNGGGKDRDEVRGRTRERRQSKDSKDSKDSNGIKNPKHKKTPIYVYEYDEYGYDRLKLVKREVGDEDSRSGSGGEWD
jgi:hypothetical protein